MLSLQHSARAQKPPKNDSIAMNLVFLVVVFFVCIRLFVCCHTYLKIHSENSNALWAPSTRERYGLCINCFENNMVQTTWSKRAYIVIDGNPCTDSAQMAIQWTARYVSTNYLCRTHTHTMCWLQCCERVAVCIEFPQPRQPGNSNNENLDMSINYSLFNYMLLICQPIRLFCSRLKSKIIIII